MALNGWHPCVYLMQEAIRMRTLQLILITIFIFVISCNNKSPESTNEVLPSELAGKEKQNQLNCNCFPGIGSKKGDKPILTFAFSNGQAISICGFVEKKMEGITVSEFNVFDCSNGKSLAEFDATEICRLIEKEDTLQVSKYRYLPIAKNWGWELTKIAELNIAMNQGNLIVSELNPAVEHFTIEEKKVEDFLNTLIKTKGQGIGKDWELEIGFLEALSINGNKKAWHILENYETFKGMKTDGAIAETWKDAVANVKWIMK